MSKPSPELLDPQAGFARCELLGDVSRRTAAKALAGAALLAPGAVGGTAKAAAPQAGDARPRLTLGLTRNLRTIPVIEGRVSSPAIDAKVSEVDASELFLRQLRDAEFDAAEMSISSLMLAASRGDTRWVGVPVFTTRYFFHTRILVRRDAGIQVPGDLRGKKVGVPEYQQTAVMWTRGVLQDEFGIGPQDMEFWMERLPGSSHASAVGFKPPSYVHQIPPEKSIGSMMLSGELDAALLYHRTSNPQPLGDRSTADLANSPLIKPLFADPRAEAMRYYNKTGFHNINHAMVLRRPLAEQNPSLPGAIVDLFNEAAAAADADRLAHIAYYYDRGLLDDPSYKALKTPLIRHGVDANRRLLETMCRYSHEQGLSTRLMTVDEVFPSA